MDSQIVTIGSVTNGDCAGGGGGGGLCSTYYYHWFPAGDRYVYIPPSEPQSCIGKAHVFECDHERTCKCGTVTRVMPSVKARRR